MKKVWKIRLKESLRFCSWISLIDIDNKMLFCICNYWLIFRIRMSIRLSKFLGIVLRKSFRTSSSLTNLIWLSLSCLTILVKWVDFWSTSIEERNHFRNSFRFSFSLVTLMSFTSRFSSNFWRALKRKLFWVSSTPFWPIQTIP